MGILQANKAFLLPHWGLKLLYYTKVIDHLDMSTTLKILIKGITQDGVKFRPSDWAERISGNLSTFKYQRIHYSPLLYPCRIDNTNCLFVDPSLEISNSELFQQIMTFAHNNKLVVEDPR